MSRRRGGKKVSGVEMCFIICQAVAGMMLLGLLMQYVAAKMIFETGVEYLPVTITWTASESHERTYMQDGKKRTEITYDNSYRYIVDGVEYNKTMTGESYGVTQGSQSTYYYNPNDPDRITAWSSPEEMMRSGKHVVIIFIIFQAFAIFFKVKIEKEKHLLKVENKRYESTIRQDMQKNRELYRSLNMAVDESKMFSVLEPLRVRIIKNQRKLEQIEKRAGMTVGGNLFLLAFIVCMRLIDGIRVKRIQNSLDADSTAFYREYKRGIAEPILEQLFGEFQYKPSQGFSINELAEFKLFNGNIATVQSEDYIEGIYKGVGYRQADVKKEKRNDESKLNAQINGLRGRVSVYDFKKNLEGDILIVSKNSSHVDVKDMKKVEMENVAFNQKLDVYAENAHMVYYLLTPQFMEYLLQLDLRGKVVFRFSRNKIFVLRNQITGIFEPDMERTLDIPYEVGKSYNELKEILDFIDILNLDRVADEANLRASYSGAETMETLQFTSEKPKYGVVDEEDSVFGGPAFEEMETAPSENAGREEDPSDDWNKPVSSNQGSSGLKLRL